MSPEPALSRRVAESEDAPLEEVPPAFMLRGEASPPEKVERPEVRAIKGAVAGVVAGLVAGYVMEKAQAKVMPKVKEAVKEMKGEEQASGGGGGGDDPATVKAAEAVSENLLKHDIPEEKKERAGRGVHYATSALFGGLYGVGAEFVPVIRTGRGTAYGTFVWALNDEVLVPALGLSKPPTEYPLETHAYALGSHLVYGAAVDAVYGGVRRFL